MREGCGRGERNGEFCALKNGECQKEIKKNVERGSGRERERGNWWKVRVDDRLKNEEGEENPV